MAAGQEIQAYHNIKTDHVKLLFTLASALWKDCAQCTASQVFWGFFPTLFLLSYYSEIAFKLKHWLYSISFTMKHSTAITGATTQGLLPHPAASLHPSTQPRCWVSTCSVSWKVTGCRVCSVSSISGHSLGVRDFCACWISMPWQLGQLCVSEQQPVPLNYLLQLTWTCISLSFLPSLYSACCSMNKLERQMTQMMKSHQVIITKHDKALMHLHSAAFHFIWVNYCIAEHLWRVYLKMERGMGQAGCSDKPDQRKQIRHISFHTSCWVSHSAFSGFWCGKSHVLGKEQLRNWFCATDLVT